jgi:tetratricopeptide (TPR) repeat protein
VEDDAGRWRPARGADLEDVALRLPETVQTVIQSRYRGASDAAQDVLGAAAVIGHRFDVRLLESAGNVGTAILLDALDELLARRLVREPEETENGEYAFGHDKIREVVYAGLSRARRSHLHAQVAAGLEALHGERTEELAGRLVRHYAEAGQDDKALHYAILAGDQAAEQYAHTEALTHYNRALEIAERVEATPEQLVHLYTKRGRVLELDAQYGEALANYQEMEATARERGDRSAELTAVMAQVTVHATLALSDEARAEELAERAMALARDLDDRAAEAKLLWNLSLLYRSTNRLPEAVECGERSLALSRELGLREQAAFALHDLGAAYTALGRLAKAAAAGRAAGELWRELDNRPMLGDSVAGLSGLFAFAGDFERALAAAEQAFEIGASIDNVWIKVVSKGAGISLVYWEMGRPDKALAVAEECFRLTKEAEIDAFAFQRAFRGFLYGRLGAVERGLAILRRELKVAETQLRVALPVVRCMLARLHLQNDNLTAAEAVLNQSKENGDDAWEAFFAIWLGLAEGELALRQGNVERALALTSDFLAELRERGVGAYIPHFLIIRGRALLAAGRIAAAGQALEKAQAAAEEMGSRHRLWQILAALAELETRRGNEGQAEGLQREARDILTEIAGHIPTPELRDSFLTRPDVRALLRDG